MSQRLRNFVFTINNYTEEDEQQLANLDTKYMIYGYEIGKKGTAHLQGYIVLNNQTRFNTIKETLKRAHIEPRKGTHEQALEYCKKGGKYKETGSFKPGERTDLDRVREDCQFNNPMREITTYGNLQQISVAKQYLTYNEQPRDWKPEVIWICGPSGCGKSRYARELTDKDKLFIKNDESKWWDGYDSHEHIIIDDFRGSWWPLVYTLSLLDRYEKRIEIKGGFRQLKATKIIITAIRKPEQEYTFGKDEPCEQLLRRIDKTLIWDRIKESFVSEVRVSEVAGNTIPPPIEVKFMEFAKNPMIL